MQVGILHIPWMRTLGLKLNNLTKATQPECDLNPRLKILKPLFFIFHCITSPLFLREIPQIVVLAFDGNKEWIWASDPNSN